MTTTEIATYDGPSTMPSKLDYARQLAVSGLLPDDYKQKPANLLWAIEFAEMLDLSPMTAITSVHVISGKPTASAGLISALVRRAGHRLRVKGDDKEATAQIIRRDDPDYVFEVTWTIARAQTAKLTSNPNWSKYPAAMLSARAVTECARIACQEALLGVAHTPEELGATVDVDGNVIATAQRVRADQPRSIIEAAEQVTEPAPEPTVDVANLVAAVGEAQNADTLRAIWRESSALGDDDRERVRLLIGGRTEELAAQRQREAEADAAQEG